jgi:hypothetical protein
VHQLLAGEVPGQWMLVEGVKGVKGVKYATMLPKIYENSQITGGFPHFLAYKSLEMPFFSQKYLTRYTPKMFFEE